MDTNNQAKIFSNIGINDIVTEGIFVRFQELVPFVGENYYNESYHHKMILIGESNYFSSELKEKSVFTDANMWYLEKNVPLIPEEKVKDVSNAIGGYRTFTKFFNIMKKVLDERRGRYPEYILQESVFYNYFLRPAILDGKGRGFKKSCQRVDKNVAGSALVGIIDILKPDLIIFLSKYAYSEFDRYAKSNGIKFNAQIEQVCHPASIWWNRNGGTYGKLKFENILKEHWIK